ncbi:hypothetical protein ACFWWM_03380 [Streptomyces sp. NPDC058682]|uniref:hypothetical protein n=1 Tax=Streptomyces sp. NPDC058682 TaxID=3346596 RepID=UPI003650CD4E
MTHYHCGSCSFQSDDLGEAQQHSHQTGHVCIGKEDAGPVAGKFGKARVVVKASASVLAATTIGVLAWKYKKRLQEECEELQMENDYLKSATGAAKTLKGYDC